MMERRHIDREALTDALGAWIERYSVFAPQVGERSIEFAPLTSPDADVRLACPSSKWPPKRFFFPQSETLLKYDFSARGADRVSPTPPEERKTLLYGMRPCDAHAVEILDEVFLKQDGVVDPYYAARRANTTIVAVACDRPAKTCFCASMESGPHDGKGADLLLREIEGGYLVEVHSDKGAAALEGIETGDADDAQVADADARKAKAEAAAVIKTDPRALAGKLDDIFEDDVWDHIPDNCLGCGTCAYLCPTCHCFDIQDEAHGDEGRRVRNWDSCQFPSFTLHASGHNPRPRGAERWRQRAMHKFNYYPSKFGPIACVGCGRCVKDCPTGIDIRRILKTLEEAVQRHG